MRFFCAISFRLLWTHHIFGLVFCGDEKQPVAPRNAHSDSDIFVVLSFSFTLTVHTLTDMVWLDL